MSAPPNAKEIRRRMAAILREMKSAGVRRISCFNGGLTPEEYRYNAELFRLRTLLRKEG